MKYLSNIFVTIYKLVTRFACALQRMNPLLIKAGSVALTFALIAAISVSFLFMRSDAQIAQQEQDSALPGSTTVMELSPGASGSEVIRLQTALKDLGYYTDNVNGTFGTLTYHAVEKFQETNDLPSTGTANLATMELVYSGEADKAQPQRTLYDTLQYGAKGEAVQNLQRLLKVLGYLEEPCIGGYGAATRNAVKAYQQQNGLPATGIANDPTLFMLYSQTGELPEYSEVTAESGKEAIQKVQQALADMKLMAADYCNGNWGSITESALKKVQEKFGFPQTGKADGQTLKFLFATVDATGIGGTALPKYPLLEKGSEGEEVKKLQEALKRLGYFSNDATGYYGDITVDAVAAFQKYAGNKATGKAESNTQDKIFIQAEKIPVTGKTYKTLDKDSESGDVKRLQEALKQLGFFSGSTTSFYGSKTSDAVRAFQKAKGLLTTGKADVSTQKLLFNLAPEAEKIQLVEKLDWFKGGSDLIKKNVNFTVIDVATGRSFQVVRKGGVWHADSEPVSKKDTEIMRSIVGKWNWNRRAIVVVYNGRYIAASMNAMPHSPDFISNNGFPGHFCIHLAGSKIHHSGKVDPDHQSMVQRAFSQGHKVT